MATTRSQSHLTREDSDDDSDEDAEAEGQDVETEASLDEDAQGYEEDTMALLDGYRPSSPLETDIDIDLERPTVKSRYTTPDDVARLPTTPSSIPEVADVDNLFHLNDMVGDEVPVNLLPAHPIEELAVSASPLADLPLESSELDYHEPDPMLTPARPSIPPVEDEVNDGDVVEDDGIEHYLRPYAVTKVDGWDPERAIKPSSLLRGSLRPYQRTGLEWLANHHTQSFNCILADEMGRLSYPS